ncbi:MAG: anti-sigma-factor antagonist [Acidimicrobiales bacterium]|nr:anti-sigma-factor antagonist [Acidimicrobiales bacterium]
MKSSEDVSGGDEGTGSTSMAPELGTVTRDGGELVVRLRGDIDALRAPRVQTVLDGLIDGAVEKVVFDAAEIDFMDSSGVRVLVITEQRLAAVGGSVVVRNASEILVRLLEVTALDGRFIER